jgi:hypothetical protein
MSLKEEQLEACGWDKTGTLGVSDQYVVLDSFQKIEDSNSERGELSFNFNTFGPTGEQVIGVWSKITRVIEIHVSSFVMPLLQPDLFRKDTLPDHFVNALGLMDNATPYVAPNITQVRDQRQQYTFGQRITMYLSNIGIQSISDNNNKRHHFEFDITNHGTVDGDSHGDRILLTPINDRYILTTPITHVHGMLINFYNPDNPIKLTPDVAYNVVTTSQTIDGGGGECLQYQFVDRTGLMQLEVGDRVVIKGFEHVSGIGTTAIPYKTVDGVFNQYMNRSEGHIIGDDPVTLSTGPTIDPTYTGSGNRWNVYFDPYINPVKLTGTDRNPSSGTYGDIAVGSIAPRDIIRSRTRVAMYIAKYRIRIPLKFRTLSKNYTNSIVPI